MPPATVGPGPPIPPPFPGTPFTVSNGRLVLNSQMIFPSFDEKARSVPSREPVNTAPGIAVAPAQLPECQVGRAVGSGQTVGIGNNVDQARSPLAGLIAAMAPG